MQRNIDIYKNDVLVGSGKVGIKFVDNDYGVPCGKYYISDCGAVLGDNEDESEDIYNAINKALEEGKKRVDINGNIYTWSIWTMTTSKL